MKKSISIKNLVGFFFITLSTATLAAAGSVNGPGSNAACAEALKLNMYPPDFRVSAVAFDVQELTTEARFLEKITAHVEEAAAKNSDLVVFPELFIFDLLGPESSHGSYQDQQKELAKETLPRIMSQVCQLSRQKQISILAGTAPRLDGDKVFNTAYLFLADGRVILQDKIYPTAEEIGWGWSSGTELKVFDAPWGKTAILVCYDCEFPSLSAALSSHSPEVILVPSMTMSQAGFHRVRWTAMGRAIEHHAYVVHVSAVDGGKLFFGNAAVIEPQDLIFTTGILSQGRDGVSQAVHSELSVQKLRDSKNQTGTYPGRDEHLRNQNGNTVRVVTIHNP